MTLARIDLGDCNEVAAIRQVFQVSGLQVLDVGCGPGKISRELVTAGATVTGIEPDPIQAEMNRKQSPSSRLSFAEAPAEKLPASDASVDAVFFFRSLHHVPTTLMDAALKEACRAVKKGGRVVVLEPALDGTHFAVQKHYHDETVVRTAAQAALARTMPALFGNGEHYTFLMRPKYPSFETLVEQVTKQTFNNIKRDNIETKEVRALFEKSKSSRGDYEFTQPMLMDVYTKP